MGDKIGHERVVSAVLVESLVELRLKLFVSLNQFGKSLLSEIHLLSVS